MSYNLTAGCLEKIMGGGEVDRPTVQVLGQKKISGSGTTGDRYRMILSDGVKSHSSTMLGTQLNGMVTSGELDQFAVIRLDKYLCNTIQNDRRVMILLDLAVIASGNQVREKLGNPVPMRFGAGESGVQQTAPQPTPQSAPAPLQQMPVNNNKPQPGFYGNAGGGVPAKKPYIEQNISAAPSTPGGTPVRVHPISSLTPYQNRWTVKVRVTNKSAVRTWSNSRGEGKLFSMTLLDESGEIKATAFKEQVDKYYDLVELNKVYYIKKGTLKTADKRYTSIKNDYEMTFNNDTEIIPCDDDTSLPGNTFNFMKINELEKAEPNSTVDVIGIVKNAGEVSTIMTRSTNKELKKRELDLVDESQVIVRATLWGVDAENFSSAGSPVVAFKGVRVSDFGGRSLSALSSSQIIINPDIPEAHRMRGWFESEGNQIDFSRFTSDGGSGGGSHSTNWKTFEEVKTENLGLEKADYFTTKATVIFIRPENCMYMACPQPDCNKKVVDQSNGSYRCEKCQKEYPNYKWRIILSVNVADHSGNQWITCFQDTGEMLLGKSAAEIGKMKEEDENAFEQLFQDCHFKSYIFKMRAKMETYNEENRLKTVCVQATPVTYTEYNHKLISDIEKLSVV